MALKDVMHDIEGYDAVVKEIEIARRYGTDYTVQQGKMARIIDSLHPKTLQLRVSEISEATPSAKLFRLVARKGYLPPFQAGQYINLCVELGGVRTSRPYSIASPPNQTGYYDIAVRAVEDGFVSDYLLKKVTVGDEFVSSGPAGNFYHNPLFHGDDLVFLAGGSGITPFMSTIREVTDRGLARRIHLIYGSRTPDDVIYHAELEERARLHANFTYTLVISEPTPGYRGLTGFIDAQLLKKLHPDFSLAMFYICGPEAMYTYCLGELERLGVARRRIRTEVFGPPKDVTAQAGWPAGVKADTFFTITLKGKGAVDARAGEPLMASLERVGIVLPALCRSGECSLCRTKLLSGRIFQPAGVKLRKSDRQFGYIHPCLTYPLSDLELMV